MGKGAGAGGTGARVVVRIGEYVAGRLELPATPEALRHAASTMRKLARAHEGEAVALLEEPGHPTYALGRGRGAGFVRRAVRAAAAEVARR